MYNHSLAKKHKRKFSTLKSPRQGSQKAHGFFDGIEEQAKYGNDLRRRWRRMISSPLYWHRSSRLLNLDACGLTRFLGDWRKLNRATSLETGRCRCILLGKGNRWWFRNVCIGFDLIRCRLRRCQDLRCVGIRRLR